MLYVVSHCDMGNGGGEIHTALTFQIAQLKTRKMIFFPTNYPEANGVVNFRGIILWHRYVPPN